MGFLDEATNVTDVASLESELLRRETDLEKLRAQKRALDGRVDLATIVLTVQPPRLRRRRSTPRRISPASSTVWPPDGARS